MSLLRAEWQSTPENFVELVAAASADSGIYTRSAKLYCPFGGDRLRRFLGGLEDVAPTRSIRVCCVDMPPLEPPWLARVPLTSSRVHVYQSTRP